MTIKYNDLVNIEEDTTTDVSYNMCVYQFPFPESANEDLVRKNRDKRMDSMFTKFANRQR